MPASPVQLCIEGRARARARALPECIFWVQGLVAPAQLARPRAGRRLFGGGLTGAASNTTTVPATAGTAAAAAALKQNSRAARLGSAAAAGRRPFPRARALTAPRRHTPPARFVTSTIIGATSVEQLKQNLQAFEVELSQVRGALTFPTDLRSCWLADPPGSVSAGRAFRVCWRRRGMPRAHAWLRTCGVGCGASLLGRRFWPGAA